jgi:hypothetical protein
MGRTAVLQSPTVVQLQTRFLAVLPRMELARRYAPCPPNHSPRKTTNASWSGV